MSVDTNCEQLTVFRRFSSSEGVCLRFSRPSPAPAFTLSYLGLVCLFVYWKVEENWSTVQFTQCIKSAPAAAQSRATSLHHCVQFLHALFNNLLCWNDSDTELLMAHPPPHTHTHLYTWYRVTMHVFIIQISFKCKFSTRCKETHARKIIFFLNTKNTFDRALKRTSGRKSLKSSFLKSF